MRHGGDLGAAQTSQICHATAGSYEFIRPKAAPLRKLRVQAWHGEVSGKKQSEMFFAEDERRPRQTTLESIASGNQEQDCNDVERSCLQVWHLAQGMIRDTLNESDH